MAPKQIKTSRVHAHRRQPGESADEWTVRTAYLKQNKTNGRWSFVYTEVTEGPDGTNAYRQTPQACFTTDRAEALARFAQWKRERLTPAPATKHLGFADLAAHYIRDMKRDRFSNSQEKSLRPGAAYFADDPAALIGIERLNEYRDHMTGLGFRPGTVRVRLAAVLAALRHGERHGLVPAGSAPRNYRLPPTQPPRQYALNETEHALVFDRAAALVTGPRDTPIQCKEARIGLFICIAAETAARREAILRLTWDRIDFTAGREAVNFRRPEGDPPNKAAAVVPVSPRLAPVLRHAARRAGDPRTGPVFDGYMRHACFHEVVARWGFPAVTPHVFRHTWATLAVRAGMPLNHVAEVMADDISTITRTYAHLTLDDARDAIRKYMTPVALPLTLVKDAA